MFDKCVDGQMVQLVITLVSHTRGLRFESVFRHHNILDHQGQNNFHTSLTSMFDESGDVQQLLIILVSHTKHHQFKSGFGNHNCSGVVMLQMEFTNCKYPCLINTVMSASCSWLTRQSHTFAVSELSPSSGIIIILVSGVRIVFINH